MIESSSQRVTKGVDLAGAAGEALKKIQHGSEQVGSMISSIASATTEQSAATEQIARNIERINAVTKESSQGAQQAAQAASSLSENAEKLHKLVGRFKV
jgi:methyl-accepting chemotaxis protein